MPEEAETTRYDEDAARPDVAAHLVSCPSCASLLRGARLAGRSAYDTWRRELDACMARSATIS
jgi:hypothetical protein